ncbi:MAG: hypothetical protein KKA42_12600 [candidate division Zixibacteria bacterium]|nr:hypothetical protein [candidate division Zixibacteria bacterium]
MVFSAHRKSMIRLRAVVLSGIAALILAVPAQGTGVSGRLTGDVYAYENPDGTHWQSFLGLQSRAIAWRGSGRQGISLNSYFRWTGDLAGNTPDQANWRVYHGYLRLDHLVPLTRIDVGRQFVYTSVGSAVLDGITANIRPFREMEIRLFGGSSVAGEHNDRLQSLSDAASFGGRVAYRPFSSLTVGGNWFRKKSDGLTAYHRVGLDLSHDGRRLATYGRVTYDIEQLLVTDVLARVSYRDRNWYWSSEFRTRQPSVEVSSIFSLIDAVRAKDLRLDFERRVIGNIRAVGQVFVDLLDDDHSWAASTGLRTTAFTVLWHHQTGYGGDSDGLRGNAHIALDTHWTGFASANLSTYRVQEAQEERSEAYAGGLGLQYRGGAMLIRGEGQFLRNAVDESNFRALLSVTRYFGAGGR